MNNLDIETVREELVQALSRTFDDKRKIAVYGAGNSSERNVWALTEEMEDGAFEPEYYIDDTPEKHNTQFYGKRVINFEEAHSLCKGFLILICSDVTRTRSIIADSLRRDPIEGAEDFTTLDEYVFCCHSEKVLAVYDMLEDDLSKRTYANMILVRMLCTEQNQTLVRENTYYDVPEFAVAGTSEVYVDCGAYTGDTVEQYLSERQGKFEKIVAFEPFAENFRAMKDRTERLMREWRFEEKSVELIQAGVGEKTYTSKLKVDDHADGCALSGENAQGDIPVIALDDYFKRQTVSFIKADIEGYERRMLCGAENVIQRDRPKMAICIYHSAYDMCRIALKMKEICSDYRFSVRQHSHDILDTVLYAYL